MKNNEVKNNECKMFYSYRKNNINIIKNLYNIYC